MKYFLLNALGYALAALAYGVFLSLLINVQFAIDTYWLWLSFITSGFILIGFTQFIRGGETLDDRIKKRLVKKGFFRRPLFIRTYLVIIWLLESLVNVIFWPVFLLSTASFSFTGRGLITDSYASSFRMRSRQFFISSLILMVCMAWQLVANSSPSNANDGLDKFYANTFLLGTAVWLLICILRPIDIESRAYGSRLAARLRVFFGCLFSFGAFVSAMALADLLASGQLPNIQAVALEVIFGGLFSSETDAIVSSLKASFENRTITPSLSIFNEIGFLQIALILFNFLFIAAILKKTISPILQVNNFVRTDAENVAGAMAMINTGNLTDAEMFTRDLPAWRVAPTLLEMCKLLESRSFDELLKLAPSLVVARSVERGENLDVKELSDRERWILLFANMSTLFDLKSYYDFANWSVRQKYLTDMDLAQLFQTVQIRFGDENRISILLIFAVKDDAPDRVLELANKLLSPSFSDISLSEDGALSALEFSNVVLAAEAQKGWVTPFLKSALFNRIIDEQTDKSVMQNFFKYADA